MNWATDIQTYKCIHETKGWDKTNRLCKLNFKRHASHRKPLKWSHGMDGIFFLLEINESIATTRLKSDGVQLPEP